MFRAGRVGHAIRTSSESLAYTFDSLGTRPENDVRGQLAVTSEYQLGPMRKKI